MSDRLWVRLAGEDIVSETATYDIEHVEHGDGEAFGVELTVTLGGLSFTADFDLEAAETFLIEFRDEIVRAKQAKLEWETDTDPSTGVAEDDDRQSR